MGAMILTEIGDFSRFASPDKLLVFAALTHSTYQSGKLNGSYAQWRREVSIIYVIL